METQVIIEEVRKSGLKIGLRNNQIAVKPVSLLNDNLRAQIRGNCDDITLAIKNAPSRLVQLAIHAGIHEQGIQFSPSNIRRLVSNEDLQDVVNCTRHEMQAWASALAIRAMQHCGQMPRGWDRTSICRQCGPVYSFHDLDSLSCGWCWMRHAGLHFLQPGNVRVMIESGV